MAGNIESNIINSLVNVQGNIVNSLTNLEKNLNNLNNLNTNTALDVNNTNTQTLLDAINALNIKDLREKIVERGYLKVGLPNWPFRSFAKLLNPNTKDFTAEGYLPDICRMHATALFGDDTLRIEDTDGNVIQSGKLLFVATTTGTRFDQFNNDEFDILMHAVTGTVDRLVNKNVKCSTPYFIADTRSVVETTYYAAGKTYTDIVDDIVSAKGVCKLGTSDNCTALLFSQRFKQLYSDPSKIEIVITTKGNGGVGTDYEIYSTDGWALTYFSNVNPAVTILPLPTNQELILADKLYVGYRHNEMNNDMDRLSKIILNILFRAVETGVTKANAATFDTTDKPSAEALLDGTDGGGTSVYSTLKMPNDKYGRVILSKFGNIEEIAAKVNNDTTGLGVGAMPIEFGSGDYGINVYAVNA